MVKKRLLHSHGMPFIFMYNLPLDHVLKLAAELPGLCERVR